MHIFLHRNLTYSFETLKCDSILSLTINVSIVTKISSQIYAAALP